ncbi:MAG TPA: CDP-alcohol phosphatidyltransferase family protein [Anaerolineales bacterium]|nr:CDP-alcohol phosphatidyltransferase family protein [Anaerolineales bacterium]
MSIQVLGSKNQLTSLQKQWAGLTFSGTAFLVAHFIGLLAAWPDHAWRWLGLAAAGGLWLSWLLWRSLSLNRAPDSDRLLPAIGPGTQLTLLRGLLLAALAGLLFSPRPPGWLAWLPGLYYTLAAIADLFDGYLARRSGQVTLLGERLDLSLDGVGVLVAALLVVQYGQAPAWYLLVGLVRYLFVAWIWLRQRWGMRVYELPSSATRRPFAGAQMGALAVLLWPVFTPPGTHLAAALFAMPFLIGFARDGLAVSGWTVPGRGARKAGSTDGIQTSLVSPSTGPSWLRTLTHWLPLLLRLGVVLLLVARLSTQIAADPSPAFLESRQGLALFSPAVATLLGFQLLGLVLIAFGAAGRLGALAVLFAAGFHQHLAGLDLVDLLLITGGTCLFFLGTGPLSLWKPEDRIIQKRLGET